MSRQLLLSYLSLTIFVLAVLMIPLGLADARTERRDLEARVEGDAMVFASLAEDSLQAGASALVTRSLSPRARSYQRQTGGRVVIVDRAGKTVIDTHPSTPPASSFASRPEIATALAGRVATGERHSTTLGADLLYVGVPVASGGTVYGAVRITFPTSAIDRRVHRYWLLLALIAALILASATLIGLRFARSITRPLEVVQEAATRLGAGDLTTRAPVHDGPPEVRRLAVQVNEMAAKLERLIGAQEAFVADASHELRTPLTALRLRLENAESAGDESRREDLEGALDEVGRISQLVDSLLTLARFDRSRGEVAAIDTGTVIAERAEAWSPLLEEREIELATVLEDHVAVLATPGALEQTLDNLLANAVEVAPAGSTITITTAAAGTDVVLRVTDQGPGLTADQRARAFDRFWRAEARGSGSGLGLSIVHRLVTADGGTITLEDAPGSGLDVVIRLRRAAG